MADLAELKMEFNDKSFISFCLKKQRDFNPSSKIFLETLKVLLTFTFTFDFNLLSIQPLSICIQQ